MYGILVYFLLVAINVALFGGILFTIIYTENKFFTNKQVDALLGAMIFLVINVVVLLLIYVQFNLNDYFLEQFDCHYNVVQEDEKCVIDFETIKKDE